MTSGVALDALGMVCALGSDLDEIYRNLMAGESPGMRLTSDFSPNAPCFVGRVLADLPDIPQALRHFDSRNNRLLVAAAIQIRPAVDDAIERFGAHRVGVVLGTGTSGISIAETAICQYVATGKMPADYDYRRQQMSSGSDFLAQLLAIGGPALTISTACSSSAHAIATARRFILSGLCDAVITGGADSLCALTVRGFQALESVSCGISNPLSVNRDGINIGEGSALFLMTHSQGPLRLEGSGASSDAHHISAPDPTSRGAVAAIEAALADAAIDPASVDYVNLHGTGTPLNDAMEAAAIAQVFPKDVVATSTKPYTGHALGSAGALELGLCWLLLSDRNPDGRTPPHRWDGCIDESIAPLRLARTRTGTPLKRCVSNSFAFGGNNAALVIAHHS